MGPACRFYHVSNFVGPDPSSSSNCTIFAFRIFGLKGHSNFPMKRFLISKSGLTFICLRADFLTEYLHDLSLKVYVRPLLLLSAILACPGQSSVFRLMPKLAGGYGGGEASRPPCTTHASGQPLLYKASRLNTA